MIGDVIGQPGRRAVQTLVLGLRREYEIDLVIANGENIAGGFGLTPDTVGELMDGEVDIITSGNHVWKQKEIIPYINEEWPLIRPANYPPGTPGRGYIRLGQDCGGEPDGKGLHGPAGLPLQDRRFAPRRDKWKQAPPKP